MDFNEYQELAARTDNHIVDPNRMIQYSQLLIGAIGACGEAGELLDEVKKVVFHGHELNKEKILKESGDLLWYCSKIVREINETLEDTAEANIEKLRKRYPEGFSEQRSRERCDPS